MEFLPQVKDDLTGTGAPVGRMSQHPIIGLLQLDIHIPGACSLKDKRRHIKSFRESLRARFNVSVAEIGDPDLWQRLHLAVTMVSNEEKHVSETFDKAVAVVARDTEIEILSKQVEFL